MRQSVAPPKLDPPPQVVAPEQPPPARRPRRGGAAAWITAALFAVLGLAAAAVFVVLPEWVAAREAAERAAAQLPETERATSPPGAPDGEEPARPEPARPEPARQEPARQERNGQASPRVATEARAASRPAPSADRPPAPAPAPAATTTRRDGGRAFDQAMSEGLSALEGGDYAAAREAFSRAAGLEPQSRQSADGLARAELGLRLAEITSLGTEAEALEADESWRPAAERYARVLALDPTVEFAQRGLERAQARAELDERLDFYLTHPHRLASGEVLEEASAIHARGAAIDAPGPELERQVADLGELLRAYSTPVRAVLVSDGETDVTIYRVGRLGAFERRVTELLPGTYTVIGSRRGYRDVRRRLVIEPGAEPEPLEVRCREEV